MSERPSVAETAAKGDRLATLEALRAKVAAGIDRCHDAKDLAALALRLQMVLRDIHELGGTADEGEADDLAERRRRKLSSAAGS